MGQKVNPHGLRVGVIKNWDSRWFVKDEQIGDTIVSDYNIRKYLKSELKKDHEKDKEKNRDAGVAKIEIERDAHRVRVFIHCAKPGIVIGSSGTVIEKYKNTIEKMVGMPVSLNVVEIRQPDLCAQLVAENIASQLEKRVAFRRAMKMAIRNTMRQGAKGIKISCGGRLGGAEIARTEHYHEGTIPLQTLRADIDYGFWEAATTYGRIGIKVWIYNGEVLNEVNRPREARTENRGNRRPQGERRERRDGDRRQGDRRPQGDRTQGHRRGGGRFEKPEYKGGNRIARPAQAQQPQAEKTPAEGGNKDVNA